MRRDCGIGTGSAERRDGCRGHTAASSAPVQGMKEIQLCSSRQHVVGGRETAAQNEVLEAQDGDKEKPFFPLEQLDGARPKGGWMISITGDFVVQLGEALNSLV